MEYFFGACGGCGVGVECVGAVLDARCRHARARNSLKVLYSRFLQNYRTVPYVRNVRNVSTVSTVSLNHWVNALSYDHVDLNYDHHGQVNLRLELLWIWEQLF